MSQFRELCSRCGVFNALCHKKDCPCTIGEDLLYVAERETLANMNIQPANVKRRSARLWDVGFDYERRYYLGALGGKTVNVVEHVNGKTTQLPSFTMPPGDELQRVNASAWMPLLLIGAAHDKFCTQVCRLAYGSPLPDYAGDWSFIRDMPVEQIWHLLDQVRHRWFSVAPVVKAHFAQP